MHRRDNVANGGPQSIKELPPAHLGFVPHPSELFYSVVNLPPDLCPPRRLFSGWPCISHEDVCHYMYFSV